MKNSTTENPGLNNDEKLIPIRPEWAKQAGLSEEKYMEMYQRSIEEPESFWAEQAERLDWVERWHAVKNTRFSGGISIRWFEGGKLNVTANCIDRHLKDRADQVAIIWEPDEPGEACRKVTYRELHENVGRFANLLKANGVKKGDRVTIYLPTIPEAAFALLACARIGAIHSVVFGGFAPDSLMGRIQDCASNFLITADEGVRGGKTVPLKANVDEALTQCPTVEKVLVIRRTGGQVSWKEGRDLWYHEEIGKYPAECPAEVMDAEDPLFILYTSGSTGKPKGVLHTSAGYLLFVSLSFQYVFDYRPGEVFWCTADIGWVTGHSYVVYGPLCNGATVMMFEGIPTYPNCSRSWEIIDKHQVNIFYTAPTAIRSLMREGEAPVKCSSRKSLRLLGSVGEPINPEAWLWYYRTVGESRCPVVDTWWQTETGGIMISPIAGATPLKPGSATRPFFGVKPAVVDNEGKELIGPCEGNLCIVDSWPGQARTIYRDHARFEQTYFSTYRGKYSTGDGCRRDQDGYYWITGRVDDVLNVSGHRLGTAEIESALVAHPSVAEAAVVGFPHDIKGQGIYAYITLKKDIIATAELQNELAQWVKKHISAIAAPDQIQWAPGLPKTRSGKIMRRILRKIAAHEFESLGDLTTLADPEVVVELIKERPAA